MTVHILTFFNSKRMGSARLSPALACVLALLSISCSRNAGDHLPELLLLDAIAPPEYSVGGEINGLFGSEFMLENTFSGHHEGEQISTAEMAGNSDGSAVAFVFPDKLITLQTYSIAVAGYPRTPTQICELQNTTGTVHNSSIDDVRATCEEAYRITGSLSGLSGSGLILQNNSTDDLSLNTNGGYEFFTPVRPGDPYGATVSQQPENPWQTCSFGPTMVDPVSGNVGTTEIVLPALTCTTNAYDVIASINNLSAEGLNLSLNGGTAQAVPSVSTSHNAGSLLSGSSYNLVITGQPTGQNCTITGASGTITNSNVHPSIGCTTYGYLIGGNITELDGTGLTLQLSENGSVVETVSATGTSYIFSKSINYGNDYTVEITGAPTDQDCRFISNEDHTITGTNVTANQTDLHIRCAYHSFAISKSQFGIHEGIAESFTIRLTGKPWHPVTLNLSDNSGGKISISPSSLSFDETNWSNDATVTIGSTRSNATAENYDHTDYTVTMSITTTDPNYNLEPDPTITISGIGDDDVFTAPAPELRFHAEAGQGVITDANGLITHWADISGNVITGTSSTSVPLPVLKTGALNNQPVVDFDDTIESIIWFDKQTLFQTTAPTIIAVAQPGYTISTKSFGGAESYKRQLELWGLTFRSGDDGTGTSSCSVASGEYAVFSATGSADHQVILSVNGYAETKTNSGNSLYYSNAAFNTASFRFGAADGNYKGGIAEYVLYHGVLTDTERKTIEDYLMDKYGISAFASCP